MPARRTPSGGRQASRSGSSVSTAARSASTRSAARRRSGRRRLRGRRAPRRPRWPHRGGSARRGGPGARRRGGRCRRRGRSGRANASTRTAAAAENGRRRRRATVSTPRRRPRRTSGTTRRVGRVSGEVSPIGWRQWTMAGLPRLPRRIVATSALAASATTSAERRKPSSRSWAEAMRRGIRPSSWAAARSRSTAMGASLISQSLSRRPQYTRSAEVAPNRRLGPCCGRDGREAGP